MVFGSGLCFVLVCWMVCVIQNMMFGLGLCLSGWKGIGECFGVIVRYSVVCSCLGLCWFMFRVGFKYCVISYIIIHILYYYYIIISYLILYSNLLPILLSFLSLFPPPNRSLHLRSLSVFCPFLKLINILLFWVGKVSELEFMFDDLYRVRF